MKAKLIVMIFLSFGTIASWSQSKQLKKGVKKIQKGEFELAIVDLSRYANKGEVAGEANFYIGEAYRMSNRIREAEPYYRQALRLGYHEEEAYFRYAFSLKSNGKYDEAKDQLQKYLEVAQDPDMMEHARLELNNLDKVNEILNQKNYYRVRNLEAINSENAEYSPIFEDGELYFTSNRDISKVYKATGTGFTDLYKVKTEGAVVNVSTLEALPDYINIYNINEGSITFSRDGKTMVFARGNSGKKSGTEEVNLYISRFRNREWSEPVMMNINKPGIWTSTPAFSSNGRVLYFASNREGYGGIDLFQASLDRRGRYGNVKNLGPEINTPGNEMFPFVADDGKLFFASDGHPGLGGLDIMVATRRNGKTTVINLGPPINSISDDFGYFLFRADRGFFSSNRDGGKGDDDIYTFLNQDPDLKIVNYFLAGVTKTRDDKDNEDILGNVKVQLLRVENDQTFEVDEVITGDDGQFLFPVAEHEHYVLIGEKLGQSEIKYFTTRMPYTTVGKSVPQEQLTKLVTDITLDTIMYLDKIVIDKEIVLENIFYDFNQWNIRDDAAQELDKLVDILLDNPEISIELSSHTDSIGSNAFNLRLSQRRAESAVDYIVSRGIDRNRIVARGYGESRPIASNTNPDGTDNPEGRQKNRRTEFKVIRINPGEGEEFFDEDRFFDNKDENDDGNGGGG